MRRASLGIPMPDTLRSIAEDIVSWGPHYSTANRKTGRCGICYEEIQPEKADGGHHFQCPFLRLQRTLEENSDA